jgi:hypothetical protein
MKSEVLTVVRMAVFWVLMPCRLVGRYLQVFVSSYEFTLRQNPSSRSKELSNELSGLTKGERDDLSI